MNRAERGRKSNSKRPEERLIMKKRRSLVTYDARSFIIDGTRRWLTSGSMHYWRTPRESWRDRLEKAKSFGLNCIQTYVYWGLHEKERGRYDFESELDIDAFLALCAELDLYVFVRPGPYICAEVSMGGFPAWMLSIRGLEFRRLNSLYLREVDRWFETLVPIIAKRQIGRDGTVILYQIENELGNVRRSELDAHLYLEHLARTAQRLCIDVPITTCMGGTEEAIECINSHQPADLFAEMRAKQPDAPLHATEFWPFWYHTWEDHPTWMLRTPEELAYQTWRVLAEGGAGYNYYMWHGGTNFGHSVMYGHTTGYGDVTVLEESGEVAERFRITAACARAAQAIEPALAASAPVRPSLRTDNKALKTFTRSGDKGSVSFVLNPTERLHRAHVTATDGVEYDIEIPAKGCRIHLSEAEMDAGLRVSRSTAHVHALVSTDNAWLVAVASPPPDGSCEFVAQTGDDEITVSITGKKRISVVTKRIGDKGLTLVIVPTAIERDIHPVENALVVGGEWVGTTSAGTMLQESKSAPGMQIVGIDGKKKRPKRIKRSKPVWTLGAWQCAAADDEAKPDYDDSRWTVDSQPLAMDLHGDYKGYAWYRSRFTVPRPYIQELYLSAFADRANVHLNGRLIHQTEPPPEDRSATPSARVPLGCLSKGEYDLAVLVENMGHIKGEWQINANGHHRLWMQDDLKGLLGPVMVGRFAEALEQWRYRARLSIEDGEGFNPDRLSWNPLGRARARGMRYLRTTLTCKGRPDAAPVYLVAKGLTKGMLWLNGRLVGRIWPAREYVEQWLPDAWLERRNEIVLLEESGASPSQVRVRLGPQRIPIRG